jgi:hypothetical protein
MAITTWAATTGDWDDSKFDRGWDGPSISPAVGSLTASFTAPTVKISYSISPGKADIELIQSYEWDQLTATWDTVIGDWSSGPVPHVAVGTAITPAKADLSLVTYAPAQGIVYTFPVANGDLTLTGKVPFAGLGTTISPAKGDLEVLNSHTWDNYGGTWAAATTNWNDDTFAPDAVETGQNQPAVAELTLTTYAPRRTESLGFPIPNGDLTLSSTAPAHGVSHFRSPGKADLTGLSSATWESYGGDWASASDSWGVGTLTPTVGITYTFPIDGDEFVLTTYAPQWPHVKDPNFVSEVILS